MDMTFQYLEWVTIFEFGAYFGLFYILKVGNAVLRPQVGTV
jgi:hypothetical protein